MTRQEFIENVNDWYDLKDFCSDNDCDILDDIYDEDGMDSEIEYYIGEYRNDYSWRELRDILYDIPVGYEFYRENGAFDWVGLDDSDFRDYKDNVLEWMDDGGYWGEGDEDDYFDDEPALVNDDLFSPGEEDDEDELIVEEDFSVGDLIGMCSVTYVTIQQDTLRREQEEKAAFSQFINPNMPRVLQ